MFSNRFFTAFCSFLAISEDPFGMVQISCIVDTDVTNQCYSTASLLEIDPQILHPVPGAGNAHGLGTCP